MLKTAPSAKIRREVLSFNSLTEIYMYFTFKPWRDTTSVLFIFVGYDFQSFPFVLKCWCWCFTCLVHMHAITYNWPLNLKGVKAVCVMCMFFFSQGINKLRFVCFRLLIFAVYLLLLFTIHVFAFPIQLVDCFVVFGSAYCPILVISI